MSDRIDEVIQLLSNTPCARAKGAIEIRPFWNFSEKFEGIKYDKVLQQSRI